jgi:hypothetical protein
VNIPGQRGYVRLELRFWLSAPGGFEPATRYLEVPGDVSGILRDVENICL